MATFTYPHFHPTVASVAEGKMKSLGSHDLRALAAAFKELTGVDVLQDGVSATRIYEEGRWRRQGCLKLDMRDGDRRVTPRELLEP